MGLLTEYPGWFILLCLLLAAMYAMVLYIRTNRELINPLLSWVMAGFRFLTVFLISFLLLSPLLKQQFTMVEKPVIILGTDNSQSMVLGRDSARIKGEVQASLNELVKTLEEKYTIRTYSFGEGVQSPGVIDFHEKLTNISQFFAEIENRYLNRNVGAVILASDGIYTVGADPVYTTQNLPYPVFTVALGDTADHRDVLVKRVHFNNQVFVGDDFPLEIQVDAIRCDNEQAMLTVKEKNKVKQQMAVSIPGGHFSRMIQIRLEAGSPGWHQYSIELAPLDGEVNTENNRKDIFIEVVDVRTKIVLVSDAPHPDIGAIRDALADNDKFEFIERSTDAFQVSLDTAALIIFYQVPGIRGSRITGSRIDSLSSALFILGSQSDIPAFNRLNAGMIIHGSPPTFSESQPVINQSFPYFTTSQPVASLVPKCPPLQSPFGTYQYSPLTEIFLFQQMNGLTTRFPLISFIQTADQKRGFILGENLWRWKMANFSETGDHLAFNEMVHKIIQYLSVRQDRSFFRVRVKSSFFENEPVEMEAELYNQSYELINDPDVSLTITDESEKNYTFTFGQTGSAYFLRAGAFPPGIYTYRANVVTGNSRYEKTGSFIVAPVNLEAVSLTADHNLLFRLAESHRGKLLYPDEIKTIPGLLEQNPEIHSISTVQKIFSELINAPWVFLLILGLLTTEWAIRKYTGLK